MKLQPIVLPTVLGILTAVSWAGTPVQADVTPTIPPAASGVFQSSNIPNDLLTVTGDIQNNDTGSGVEINSGGFGAFGPVTPGTYPTLDISDEIGFNGPYTLNPAPGPGSDTGPIPFFDIGITNLNGAAPGTYNYAGIYNIFGSDPNAAPLGSTGFTASVDLNNSGAYTIGVNRNAPSPAPVPEPAFFQLGGMLAVGGLGLLKRRRRPA